MNLTNFEDLISETILDRGMDYYEDLAVEDLQGLENGQWFAIVEGTQDYQVDIRLDDTEEIMEYRCTCPYKGEICKHVVAVLYEIRDAIELEENEDATVSANNEWKNLIREVPEKDLRTFVTEYAARDRSFRNYLSIQFSSYTGGENREKYQELVSDIFKASEDDDFGFVTNLDEVTEKLNQLFSKSKEHLKNKTHQEAFAIASAIAPACINIMDYVDDSDGDLADAINGSFNIAERILQSNAPADLKEEVFDWLLEQARNADYDDYGCADYLEPLIVDQANSPGSIQKVHQFIDDQLKNTTNKDKWSIKYQTIKFLKFKMTLYEKSGEQEKADRIIQENMDISDFRDIMVERQLQRGNDQQARELIKEGIKIAEQEGLLGVVSNWKEKLLNISQRKKDIESTRKWALDLLLNQPHDKMKYYKTYKQTFPPEDWEHEKHNVIHKLQKDDEKPIGLGFGGPTTLTRVYIEEKMWDELYQWVESAPNVHVLDTFLPYLKNQYAEKLLPLYRKSIIKQAERPSKRSGYKTLASHLKKMATIPGGKDKAMELARELMRKHSNRPAMKDEFRIAGFN